MPRLLREAVLVSLVLIGSIATANEPIYPGVNINVVGPPPAASDALADRGHRQQNEPSCAVNPENTDRICCGFNDYRGVDVPGLEEA